MLASEDRDVKAPRPRFNSTEQKILNALAGNRMVGKAIAKAAHLEFSGTFQQTLAAMARARFIESEGDGYVVHPYWRWLVEDEETSEETG
jgi:hypothetical protein